MTSHKSCVELCGQLNRANVVFSCESNELYWFVVYLDWFDL